LKRDAEGIGEEWRMGREIPSPADKRLWEAPKAPPSGIQD